jgi:hypothetical protein
MNGKTGYDYRLAWVVDGRWWAIGYLEALVDARAAGSGLQDRTSTSRRGR